MKPIKTKSVFILNFLKLYNMLWRLCLPFLKKNKRLKHGFEHRKDTEHLSGAKIWIQAASAGEAYLAVSLIRKLRFKRPTAVLVTTLTIQGMDILEENLTREKISSEMNLSIQWFPFDSPAIMKKAVEKVNPDVMVLLETEIWPAHLYYLKKNRSTVMIVNARLSEKSFKTYLRTKFLWRHLEPDQILATSKRDQNRYAQLFDTADVGVMDNIKFEAVETSDATSRTVLQLNSILSGPYPLTILASIRKEEEKTVLQMIQSLLHRYPNQVIALFPRHMHRIAAWEEHLKKKRFNYTLRSDLTQPLKEAGIILWDRFGELKAAYPFSKAVFMGGSLKPLGGQNFIEPAIQGAATITGPYYDDFKWVGEEIFTHGIVEVKPNTEAVCNAILNILETPLNRHARVKACQDYIQSMQGGSDFACDQILEKIL